MIDKIEADIGNVIKLYKKEYKDGTFIALLVERDNKKYLVSLGADAVTKNQRARVKEIPLFLLCLFYIFFDEIALSIALAAVFPAPIAEITVAAPVTASPPA